MGLTTPPLHPAGLHHDTLQCFRWCSTFGYQGNQRPCHEGTPSAPTQGSTRLGNAIQPWEMMGCVAIDGVCGNRWGGWNSGTGRWCVNFSCILFFGFDILVLFEISFYLKLAASSLSGILPYFVRNGELLAGVRLEIKHHKKTRFVP